VSDPHSSW